MPLLSSYIEKFTGLRTLVIGDIMLDRFIYGNVKRISPEAPVPVFNYEHEKEMLGGAGNVAANLRALGCKSTFIGIVGQDTNGQRIASLLHNCGVNAHLLKLPNYPTIVKTRLIAGNNHLLRADQEEKLPIISELIPRFEKILYQAINYSDIVILSDYNKGLLTTDTVPIIIKISHWLNKKIIIDPKGSDYSKYRGATLVKPNLKEFSEATGQDFSISSPNFQNEIKKGAQRCFEKYQIKNIIVTLSEHGMLHISAEQPEDLQQIPTEAKEVFDVSGAGDTAIAVLGAALGRQASFKEAMKLANIASGIAVGKLGTATVTQSELKNALSKRENPENNWPQKRKIITVEEAENIIRHFKAEGKIIGFTNGCFDCCHLGHLSSFIQTKKECDILIVGLNSDASIKRYKGPSRPIQDEKTRAMLLASLEMIDYVIVFNEDTPLNLINALRPDILAKEGYTFADWPEARFVTAYGGRAVTLNRLDGYSTTQLVQNMKG